MNQLLLLTWLGYFVLTAPFLHDTICYFAPFFFLFVNLSCFLAAAFTDPGIVPRRHKNLVDSYIAYFLESNASKYSYCVTCRIIKPERTRHCKHCNNCVQVLSCVLTIDLYACLFVCAYICVSYP